MIASQAKRISSFCISNGVIDERDREKFDYCYEVFLSTLLNFAAVLLIGLVAGSLWHTVVFMLVFAALKSTAGGYHADSHIVCFAETVGTFLLYRFIAFAVPAGIVPIISGSFAVFSVITVFLLAPVGTENKPLGRRQSGQLKRDSRLIVLTLCLVTLSLLFLPVSPQWPFSVSFAASAVSFSLILGKVKLTGFRPDPDKL